MLARKKNFIWSFLPICIYTVSQQLHFKRETTERKLLLDPTHPYSGDCNFHFFQTLFLMMVLKCFNLPCNPPPTRGSGKERIRRSGPVWKGSLEQLPSVLSGNLQFSSQVSNGRSVHLQTLHRYTSSPVQSQDSKHESAAGALPSKASQASALAQVSRKDQEECQLCFSHWSKDQQRCKINNHCTAS